ncbi:MAG: tetratricopeptide repeat protein [Candidatus Brocadiales bacterium]
MNDANEWIDKGDALLHSGKYEEAITCYDKAIEINPRFANTFYNRGLAYYGKGKYDRAILDYNKALEINPRFTEAYYNRGNTYGKKGEYDHAILDYNKALEINPRFANAYNNRGNVYGGKGEYHRAIPDYNKALEIKPQHADAWRNKGDALDKLGKHEEAKDCFDKAKEIGPGKYGEESHSRPPYVTALPTKFSIAHEQSQPPHTPSQPPPSASAHVHNDRWTTDDSLGYKLYARSIAEFIQHEDSKPPFTISIQAPWGQGKTSLMKMIQKRLDPDHPDFVKNGKTQGAQKDSTIIRIKRFYTSASKKLKEWFKPPGIPTLKNPTVWFNPWKCQSSEQVWAGLAHSILSQLTKSLSKCDREKFWLKLQSRRIDINLIRTDIYLAILKTFFSKIINLLVIVFGVAGFVIAWILFDRFGLLTVGGSVVLLGFGKSYIAWTNARVEAYSEKIEGAYLRCVQQPDYVGRMGFLHLVEEDMKRVFDLLVDKEHPVVIFIDDLDRCSPTKVGQVIEAVNLFLSGDYPGSVFVLGIDAQMIAASMEVVHEKMIDKLKERGGELGWRFMDKFVQLPFVIPRLNPNQQKVYLKGLWKTKDVSKTLSSEAENKAKNILDGVRSGELEFDDAASQFAEIKSDPEVASKVGELGEGVISAFVQKSTDEDPKMLGELEKYVGYLSDNPRTIKRIVNLYRFHRCVSYARQMEGFEYAASEEIARCMVVFVRWPHFVRWLQAHAQTESSKEKGQKLIALAIKQAKSDGSVNDWTEYLKEMSIEHTGWGNDRDLWRFLRENDISDKTLLRASECGLW